MIIPLVQGVNRHHLNVETDDRGLASVEVAHTREAVTEREVVSVLVTLYDGGEDVDVVTRVANR